ncbi:hypothetical protein AERO9A_240058 [Aeromonas salmonicida]|nr:hypothetical protein AERO9A_240058 [Aeromonas salmonicida]
MIFPMQQIIGSEFDRDHIYLWGEGVLLF